MLRLAHSGLLGEDEVEGVRSSWQIALRVLDHYALHHFGQPRHVHWSMTYAPTSAATAHVFYSDGTALDAWLTRGSSGLGEVGSPCSLSFNWGEKLSGTVLAKAENRDVAITWQERNNSVLVLRTLPSPMVPGDRLLAVSWSHWNCTLDDQATQTGFDSALRTLKQRITSRGEA